MKQRELNNLKERIKVHQVAAINSLEIIYKEKNRLFSLILKRVELIKFVVNANIAKVGIPTFVFNDCLKKIAEP